MLRTNQERRKQFLAEKNRIVAQMEGDFERSSRFLERLERDCGKEARLYDSERTIPHRSGEIWNGLEGIISRSGDEHISPYVLRHYVLERDRWEEHYIVASQIKSMKKKGKLVEIDAQYRYSDGVPYPSYSGGLK